MEFNFSINTILRGTVKLEEKETASSGCFKYLESILRILGASNKMLPIGLSVRAKYREYWF